MKKTIKVLTIAGITALLALSCERTNNYSTAELIIKANGLASPTGLKSALDSQAFVLDTFLINIADIKFEFDEKNAAINDDEGDCKDTTCSDDCDDSGCGDDCNESDKCDSLNQVYAAGPYLIDIMSPEVLNGLVLDRITLPNATYNEIEFKIDRYRLDDNKQMQDRSVYITGELNGERFRLWTDKEKKIEIELPDTVNLTSDVVKFYVDISLAKIISTLETMNLGSAVDGNNNGYIEIGTNDPDGNHALAYSLIKAISNAFYADNENDDDEYHNGDIEEDEDHNQNGDNEDNDDHGDHHGDHEDDD
jgi:hypothetical protein